MLWSLGLAAALTAFVAFWLTHHWWAPGYLLMIILGIIYSHLSVKIGKSDQSIIFGLKFSMVLLVLIAICGGFWANSHGTTLVGSIGTGIAQAIVFLMALFSYFEVYDEWYNAP